jgi:hypothetical protein
VVLRLLWLPWLLLLSSVPCQCRQVQLLRQARLMRWHALHMHHTQSNHEY